MNSRNTCKRRAWLWIAALLLAVSTAASALQPAAAATGERTVSAAAKPCLNVRARPSYRGRVVDCLEAGSSVTVTMVRGGWSQITFDGDRRGWVGGRFLLAGQQPVAAPEPEPRATPAPPAPAPDAAAARIESLEAELAKVALMRPELERLAQAAAERDELVERLRTAEERAAACEAEASAARAACEAATIQAGDLSTRIEELTAERDDQANRLARAEARVLYLQSDLEETRSELMRLKGVPQQILEPEPQLPPVALPEEPEPEEPAAAGTPELPAPSRMALLDEAVAAVRAWAQAWSEQRVDDYLSFYSPSFTPTDGDSRESWEARRRQRISAPSSIQVDLDRIVPVVTGNRATVTFVQSYSSDWFSDTVSKSLALERDDDGSWSIVDERTLPAAAAPPS